MQELDDYINRVKSLPPAPRILPELLALLRKEDVDADRVVNLIAFDPAITAAVLRLCNSAVFAGAEPATDLQEAVTRLGFRQVYQLVAAVSGSRVIAAVPAGCGVNGGELWQHSVTAAVAAQLIAQGNDDDESLAFTAALLHDVGKVVLAGALEHIYGELVENTQEQQAALIEMEKRMLGAQHAEIGGRLLARWKFPETIVNAVVFHHAPAAAAPHQRLAAYVYLGNVIAYFIGHGCGAQVLAMRGRTQAIEILGLRPETLPKVLAQTLEKLQMVDALVKVTS
jgi:putative nucleotidyltransferase with HDIG domain